MNRLSISFFVVFCCSIAVHSAEAACTHEPDGTFLPDPTSRSRFIYCWGGAENIGQCDPGQEFNPFDRVCDRALSGNSPGHNPNDVCSNRPDGTFLRDPSSRNRFIYCSNGQSIVGTCNPGQEFNPVDSVCETPSSNTRDPCTNRPDGTFVTDPSSRQRFLFCSGGRSIPGYCPENQVFFEDGQFCDVDEPANRPPPAPPVRTTVARPQPTPRPTPRPPQGPAVTPRPPQGPAIPRPTPRPPNGPVTPRPTARPPQNPVPTRRPVPPRSK